jgi:hypothetical protein
MDIYVPNKRLWIPDNTIADSLASPPAISRMIAYNKHIRCLTPHRVMMGAAGSGIPGDETSYAFDGTGDFLSVPDHAFFDPGSAAFCGEVWVYANNVTGNQTIISKRASNSIADGYLVVLEGSAIKFYASSNGSGWDIASGVSIGTMSVTTWTHLAFSRASASNILLFNGGSLINTVTTSATINANSDLLRIGGDSSGGNSFDGNVDEARLSDIDRHPSGFTPSTNQFSSDGNTGFLLHCGETKTGTTGSNATSTDSGNIGHTVTENGNAIEDTVTYKI